MNKLILDLCKVLELDSECEKLNLVKEMLSEYSVTKRSVNSLDMVSSMVVKSLSLSEVDSDQDLKSLLNESKNEIKKVRKSSSVKSKVSKVSKVSKKSKSLEEEALNNMCSEAFNETSASNGVSVLDVKLSKVKLSASEKALAKAAKAEEKAAVIAAKSAEKLKAKENALALKAAEKLKAKEDALSLKAASKLKAKEDALKAKDEKSKESKAALKAEKAAKADALKAEKNALKAAKADEKAKAKEALKAEKASEKKKAKKVEEVVAVAEVEEEPDVVKRFEFEGVKYLKSKNTGIIYNMEQDMIGKWNESTQKIDFSKEDEEEEEEDYDN